MENVKVFSLLNEENISIANDWTKPAGFVWAQPLLVQAALFGGTLRQSEKRSKGNSDCLSFLVYSNGPAGKEN